MQDCFHFKVVLQSFDRSRLTKRTALSMNARLFASIGWLAPAIITAKVFMQDLWRLKCEWDDTLPDEYTNRWTHYYVQLESLSEIRIPRWIYLSKESSII